MRVREFAEGTDIRQPLLVRAAERHGDCLKLVLGDRSGSVPAVISEPVDELCRPGAVVFVSGTLTGAQLTLHAVREARAGEYVREDLHDGPAHNLDQLERDLRELVGTIQNSHLRLLLNAAFADAWAREQ